jgi:tetratricopeptide (TPR) repeat protein
MSKKIVLLSILSYSSILAQGHQHNPPDQPRVDLAKLPEPQHMNGLGGGHMEISTKSQDAQTWFDQGIAAMHCFWDYEALRAFEQSVRLDPDCAMCHWGIAEALQFRGGPDDQVKSELSKAKELSEHASDRDQRIIRAYAEANEKKSDDSDKQVSKELAILVDRHPDDVELRLLLAQTAGGQYDKGDASPGAIYSQAILRDILREHPDNAAANHYWIHAVEASDHPEWALDSANKLGALAPASGHMVHMPGHIFYRMGQYERARQIFLAAVKVDETYMAAQHVAIRDDWNYAHNLSYLVADCAEEGRYTEALEHVGSLVGIANDPDHSDNPGWYVMQIASTEARLAIRFADWDRVIEHPMQFGVPDEKLNVWARGYRDGLVAFAKGMRAADQDRLAEAKIDSDQLDALLWRLSQEKLEDKEKSRRDRVLKTLAGASLELRGNIVARSGDLAQAKQLLEKAQDAENDLGYAEPPMYARPALEVLGAAYIRAGKFDDARDAYGKALVKRRHSGFAFYGIALSWDKQGEKGRAAKAYQEFLQAWADADADLPQMKTAHTYLAGL